VTETIKRNIRATDLVARMGGDEFAILLPETARDSAHAVSRKIRKLLLDSMEENGWPVTFSIGLVTLVDSAASCTVDDLIRMADDLMYSAKEEGKNRIKHGIVDA
jgi:diguanylate cyclase (GGDEF)-like protein